MDLLLDDPPLNLYDDNWRIYSGQSAHPPHCILEAAKLEHSFISGGCIVAGSLDHAVLFTGVYIDKGSKIKNSVIMPNARIGKNVHIENAIVGENTLIEDGCRIGSDYSAGITVVGENLVIPTYTEVKNAVVNEHGLNEKKLSGKAVAGKSVL